MGELRATVESAIAAVRRCADGIEVQVGRLGAQWPGLGLSAPLQEHAQQCCAGLSDAAARVVFELALLQTEYRAASADAGEALRRLSAMDATLMTAVAALADLADALEAAAEREEASEAGYVLVIEAVAAMMQDLGRAQRATVALREAVADSAPRS